MGKSQCRARASVEAASHTPGVLGMFGIYYHFGGTCFGTA